MALSPPYIVRIERKPEAPFGHTLSEIRSWLDHRKIQPCMFRPAESAAGAFEIVFSREDEALLFQRDFHG